MFSYRSFARTLLLAGVVSVLTGITTASALSPLPRGTVSFSAGAHDRQDYGRPDAYVNMYSVRPFRDGLYLGTRIVTKKQVNSVAPTFTVRPGEMVQFVAFENTTKAYNTTQWTFNYPPYKNFFAQDGVAGRLCTINYLDALRKLITDGRESCAISLSTNLADQDYVSIAAGNVNQPLGAVEIWLQETSNPATLVKDAVVRMFDASTNAEIGRVSTANRGIATFIIEQDRLFYVDGFKGSRWYGGRMKVYYPNQTAIHYLTKDSRGRMRIADSYDGSISYVVRLNAYPQQQRRHGEVAPPSLPEAPMITRPAQDEVLGNYPRQAFVDWTDVSPIDLYQVKLEYLLGGGSEWRQYPSFDVRGSNTTTQELIGDNRFRVSVRAYANDGRSLGPWSAYRYFSYQTENPQPQPEPVGSWRYSTSQDVNFPDMQAGEKVNRSMWITNSGQLSIKFSLELTPSSNGFSLNGATNFVVAPGSEREIPVTFRPTNLGRYSGEVKVGVQILGSPSYRDRMEKTVALSGLGTSPFYYLGGNKVVFQNTEVNSISYATLKIANGSSNALDFKAGWPTNSAFGRVSEEKFRLSPGASREIKFSFKPLKENLYVGTVRLSMQGLFGVDIELAGNGTDSGLVRVDSVQGTLSTADGNADPLYLYVGDQFTVKVANTGSRFVDWKLDWTAGDLSCSEAVERNKWICKAMKSTQNAKIQGYFVDGPRFVTNTLSIKAKDRQQGEPVASVTSSRALRNGTDLDMYVGESVVFTRHFTTGGSWVWHWGSPIFKCEPFPYWDSTTVKCTAVQDGSAQVWVTFYTDNNTKSYKSNIIYATVKKR